MARTEIVTYNQLVTKAMHAPKTHGSNFVLYAKINGVTNEATATFEEGQSAASSDPEYIKASQLSYNSASNIRKVFITGKEVYVQYYTSPVVNKKQTGDNFRGKALEKDLIEVAEEIATYSQKINQYQMEKAINKNAVEPSRYNIKGNIFGVFANPWACSNIEEIYIDWTMFLSEDIKPYFPEFANENAIMTFGNKSYNASESKNTKLTDLFAQNCSGGTKHIRNRYPRLRIIAMISNLDDIMRNPSMKVVDKGFNSVEEGQQTWYQVNRDLVAQSGSMVIISDISSDLSKPNTEFVVRDNNYRFDQEILKAKFATYKTKIDDYKRQLKYGGTSDTEESAEVNTDIDLEMDDVEKRLMEIKSEYGENALKNVMIYAIRGSELSQQDLKAIFRRFTKKNRNFLATLVGIKLQ